MEAPPRECPIEAAMHVLGGKWKVLILWRLQGGACRYGALKRQLPAVSERMLVRSLRELEAAGIIFRTQYPEVPPRVEYGLTESGRALSPILEQMATWSEAHLKKRA